MKRFPWWTLGVLLALLAGLGLGLTYAWVIAPQGLVNSEPFTLRADFKDQFRAAIAASYAATGNLPRAQARLNLLGNDNLIDTLNAQAQREIANGQLAQADQLAALAVALQSGPNPQIQSTPTLENLEPLTEEPSVTPFPSPADMPLQITGTPENVEIQITPQTIPNSAVPRPTQTAQPTQGAPFQLTAVDTVCDTNLPQGLLQVMVFNSNRRQLAGIKIIVTWDSGEENFFTGLKPELGNGYADFQMEPGTAYSVQLGLGSETATDITAPTCQASDGQSFIGGYKLTFQQP
jgi:hypothetical protein